MDLIPSITSDSCSIDFKPKSYRWRQNRNNFESNGDSRTEVNSSDTEELAQNWRKKRGGKRRSTPLAGLQKADENGVSAMKWVQQNCGGLRV